MAKQPPITRGKPSPAQSQPQPQQKPTSNHPPQPSTNEPPPGFTAEDQRRETSEAARSSLKAKREAQKLTQAALGAGDPEKRQELLQEALNREVEAETFGKVAKWISSGAFQGFAYGSIPGITLGALTGTLVGGVVSLVTGGIGAGIGALTGPRFKLGDLAGRGLRRITGDWIRWDSTPEQEELLTSMVLDVKGQEVPSDEALEEMGEWKGVGGGGGQGWGAYAKSFLPGMGGQGKGVSSSSSSPEERAKAERGKAASAQAVRERMAAVADGVADGTRDSTVTDGRRTNGSPKQAPKPRSVNGGQAKRPAGSSRAAGSQTKGSTIQEPRRPASAAPSTAPKKKPRKLEVRSGQ